MWLMNWLFAWSQIHFVQLSIHAARAATLSGKFIRGKVFFVAQTLVFAGLVFASLPLLVPPLVILAFLTIVVRRTWWFPRGPKPLDIKALDWSEMTQGAVFGILLSFAFLLL